MEFQAFIFCCYFLMCGIDKPIISNFEFTNLELKESNLEEEYKVISLINNSNSFIKLF